MRTRLASVVAVVALLIGTFVAFQPAQAVTTGVAWSQPSVGSNSKLLTLSDGSLVDALCSPQASKTEMTSYSASGVSLGSAVATTSESLRPCLWQSAMGKDGTLYALTSGVSGNYVAAYGRDGGIVWRSSTTTTCTDNNLFYSGGSVYLVTSGSGSSCNGNSQFYRLSAATGQTQAS